MPVHLDDLLAPPPSQKKPHSTLDDILDYVAAGAQAIGGLVPDISGGVVDPAAIGEHAANAASTAGGYMAKHPGTVGETQAIVSAVPLIGPPVAALAEPSIEYSEGTAPTHEANVQAVGAGISLATLLAAPKAIKKLEGRFSGEAAPEPLAEPMDKPVEAISPPEPTDAPLPHVDDLLQAAGEAQAAARNRPPGVTAPPLEPLPDEEMRTAVSEQRVRDAETEARRTGAAEPTDDEIMAGASQRLGGQSPAEATRQAISEDRYRLSPQAALDREHLPIDEFIQQRFPKATINNEAGPEWVKGVLARVSDGKPGLSVEDVPPSDSGVTQHVVYRDPEGHPVAAASIVGAWPSGESLDALEWRPMVRDFATDKSQGLLASRAAGAVAQELDRMGVNDHYGEISPDAARFVQRAEAAKARNSLPGRILSQPHVDDLLEGVDEGPAPGKSYANPKYPWAQNIQIGEGVREPAAPPAEPRPPADTSWLDDMPEAEQTPPQETPMPQDLGGGLPDQLTSHPEPTSPATVRDMVSSDADKIVQTAATAKEDALKNGMDRSRWQTWNAAVTLMDDQLLNPRKATARYLKLLTPDEVATFKAVQGGKLTPTDPSVTANVQHAIDISRGDGAAGQAFRVANQIDAVPTMTYSTARAKLATLMRGMTPEETAAISMLQRGEISPTNPAVTPKVAAAQRFFAQTMQDVFAQEKAAGIPIEAKKDYWPQYRTTYDGKPNPDMPLTSYRQPGLEDASAMYHQVDDREGFSRDPLYVISRRVHDATKHVLAKQLLGDATPEAIGKWIDTQASRIYAEGGDAQLAKRILEQKFNMGTPPLPGPMKTVQALNSISGIMNTVTASLRHIGKMGNEAVVNGFGGSVKGMKGLAETLVDPKAHEDMMSIGGHNNNILGEIREDVRPFAAKVMDYIPWSRATNLVDMVGRMTSELGAGAKIQEVVDVAGGRREYMGTAAMKAKAQADALNTAKNLYNLSDETIASGKLSPEEMKFARMMASRQSQFSPTKGSAPVMATEGALGRMNYFLRKYLFRQGSFFMNEVLTPASYGNIKPLARWLAVRAPIGAAISIPYDMVTRHPDAVLNMLGVPGRPGGDESWHEWTMRMTAFALSHDLGLLYSVFGGHDLTAPVALAGVGHAGRGLGTIGKEAIGAAAVSAGSPQEWDKQQIDFPEYLRQGGENLKTLDGKNLTDLSSSTQVTALMRRWYREAHGLAPEQQRIGPPWAP